MKRKLYHSSVGVGSLVLLFAVMDTRPCGQPGGTIAPVPTLGGSALQINDLNAAGQFTGFSYMPGDEINHAFRFSGGIMTDLGTLGGNLSQGFAINSAGYVVGDADVSEFETHAILYDGTNLVDLGTLGGFFSSATALNDAGQIVGFSLTEDFAQKAFIYENGTMFDLGDLGGGGSTAVGINNAGNVIGDAFTIDFDQHAFFWTNGTMLDLGTLGGNYSSANDINDAHVVVGESSVANGDTHGFVYSGGVMTDVGTLGGNFSSAHSVNSSGQVIGLSTTSNGQLHGFFYSGGSLVDLGTLGGDFSVALGINNLGQVVGDSALSNGTAHAILWQNGVLVDLNTLLPTNSGWELLSARLINDGGRVVGLGKINGVSQTFVLDLGSANNAPVAVATADAVVECSSLVTLNGSQSTDSDNDLLSYVWTEGTTLLGTNAIIQVALPSGTHVITLTVTDPCQASAQTNVVVQVVDSTAPVIVGGPALGTVSANAQCQAGVPAVVADIVATDNCAAANNLQISQDPAAGTLVGLGTHTILVTVTDTAGNSSAGTLSFSVVDSTAPGIVSVAGPISVSVGANCQAAIPGVTTAVVATDNCSAANQLTFSQNPVVGTSVGLGQHTVAVTVSDPAGNTASANVLVNVVDATAPTIVSAPLSVTVSVGNSCQGAVPNVLGDVVATDNCTAAGQLTVTQSPAAGTLLATGPHTITVTVTDASGNSATKQVTLLIKDNTAPVTNSLSVTPNVLTPPNHMIIPVTVSVSATDNCDPAPKSKIISITCNEASDPGDFQITGDLTANLVATRNPGNGRVYSITVEVSDVSGNTTTGVVTVTVPKGNGGGGGGKP